MSNRDRRMYCDAPHATVTQPRRSSIRAPGSDHHYSRSSVLQQYSGSSASFSIGSSGDVSSSTKKQVPLPMNISSQPEERVQHGVVVILADSEDKQAQLVQALKDKGNYAVMAPADVRSLSNASSRDNVCATIKNHLANQKHVILVLEGSAMFMAEMMEQTLPSSLLPGVSAFVLISSGDEAGPTGQTESQNVLRTLAANRRKPVLICAKHFALGDQNKELSIEQVQRNVSVLNWEIEEREHFSSLSAKVLDFINTQVDVPITEPSSSNSDRKNEKREPKEKKNGTLTPNKTGAEGKMAMPVQNSSIPGPLSQEKRTATSPPRSTTVKMEVARMLLGLKEMRLSGQRRQDDDEGVEDQEAELNREYLSVLSSRL